MPRTTRAPSPSSPGGRTRRMTCHPTRSCFTCRPRPLAARRARRSKGLLSSQKLGTHRDWGCTRQDKGEYGTITQVPDGKNPTSVPTPVMDAKTRLPSTGPSATTCRRRTRRPWARAASSCFARRDLGGGAVCRRIRLSHTATRMVDDKVRGLAAHRDRRRAGEGGAERQRDSSEWTDGRKDITVENLLRMDSGIQWDRTYDLGTPITRMLYLEPSMAGYVSSLPLAHPVGTVQQYSSGSTNLLCSVLQNRFGHTDDAPRTSHGPALRAAGTVLCRARAGRDRAAGVLVLPVGDAARLGSHRSVRPARTANGTETSCCRPTG